MDQKFYWWIQEPVNLYQMISLEAPQNYSSSSSCWVVVALVFLTIIIGAPDVDRVLQPLERDGFMSWGKIAWPTLF